MTRCHREGKTALTSLGGLGPEKWLMGGKMYMFRVGTFLSVYGDMNQMVDGSTSVVLSYENDEVI